ncbi:MAG TPA: DUF4389 domain-containing protein [Nocardioidaceae bacterium]|nr:DUF4389 domain-containing protein [Nocardioidaceae bacterium]
MSTPVYPVHVDADLDTHLSRWLWLVKWVLAIPHFVILAFLWVAFVLLTAVAMFAILFTGRYPRGIFEFNVGVLRWSWRVTYYTYGALATDHYPPFTLDEVPDYPAHFSVDYPEHLSRGLVLVKWWLLAIPHYLIVALLAGSGLYVAWDTTQGNGGGAEYGWSGGLIGLLALVAAVMLLVTGRYPQQLFDLILGLNRWVLRVAAYAGLMTDEYPPFRLDMGGHEAGGGTARVAVPTTAPPPPGHAAPWGAGRVVTMVLGALVFLVAGGLLTGGVTLGVADRTLRNDAGFLMSPLQEVSTSTYAVATEPLTIDTGTSGDYVPQALLGDVTLRAHSTGADDLFVGVARSADAESYLAGVEHTTLVDVEGVGENRTPVYRDSAGAAPEVEPLQSDIWVASASGPGEQQLTWAPEGGDWTVVVMNADATAGVGADVSVGAEAPVLGWVVLALLVGGGLLLLVSIALVLAALYAGRRREAPAAMTTEPPGANPPERQ